MVFESMVLSLQFGIYARYDHILDDRVELDSLLSG